MEDHEKMTHLEERATALGYKPQKENPCNLLLPYSNKLDEESAAHYSNIKLTIGNAILLHDFDNILNGFRSLDKYVVAYDLKFPKEDHVLYIRILYDIVTSPDLSFHTVSPYIQFMYNLMCKPKYLAFGEDLVLDWYPLYKLYMRNVERSSLEKAAANLPPKFLHHMVNLLQMTKYYYPSSVAADIMAEIMPRFMPFDHSWNSIVFRVFKNFLPSMLTNQLDSTSDTTPDVRWVYEIMDSWLASGFCCHYWEQDLYCLMASVARNDTKRLVNWEPYLAFIFGKLKESFNLVARFCRKKSSKMNYANVSDWLVATMGNGSSTQKHLNQLFNSLRSYCYPANSTPFLAYVMEFLNKMSERFMARLNYERNDTKTWYFVRVKENMLTDEDVETFVNSVQSIGLEAIYNGKMTNLNVVFKNLANMRPDIVVPPLIEILYPLLDSATDAKKMMSVFECVACVVRSLVSGGESYPDGPTHVVSLMLAVLPGIDTNDFPKTCISMVFLIMVMKLVPIVDCSNVPARYAQELSPEENLTCDSTAQFEEFFLQFVDRCIKLVENFSSSTENMDFVNNLDNTNIIDYSLKEITKWGIHVSFSRTSKAIATAAFQKIQSFASSCIISRDSSAELMGILLHSAALNSGEECQRVYMNGLCDWLLEHLTDEVLNDETTSDELIYKLNLISCLYNDNDITRISLEEFDEKLALIMEKGLKMKNKIGYKTTSRMLKNYIKHFLMISARYVHDQDSLPIKDWGKNCHRFQTDFQWIHPDERSVRHVEKLLRRFLIPQLQSIEAYLHDPNLLKKEDLHQTLYIISVILSSGVCPFIFQWDEPALEPFAHGQWNVATSTDATIKMPDGSNMYKYVANLMHRFQACVVQRDEDDTNSLLQINSIWRSLLFPFGFTTTGEITFAAMFSNFVKLLSDQMEKPDCRLPPVVVAEELSKRHEDRLTNLTFTFTQMHKDITEDIYQLAISRYTEVRKGAQKTLSIVLERYYFSYKIIEEKLYQSLKVDPEQNHEELKGAYNIIIMKIMDTPFLFNYGYDVLFSIVKAVMSNLAIEKLSIINLHVKFASLFKSQYAPIQINLTVPSRSLTYAKNLFAPGDYPTEDKLNFAIENHKIRMSENLSSYETNMSFLLNHIKEGSLPWRYQQSGSTILYRLMTSEVPYMTEGVAYFLGRVIDDGAYIRKPALEMSTIILKRLKVPPTKYEMDTSTFAKSTVKGYRQDLQPLLYDEKNFCRTEDDWNKRKIFEAKPNCFYSWPKKIMVYHPISEQPHGTQQSSHGKAVDAAFDKFFSSEENVDSLVKYYSMEERKGRDKFRDYVFKFYKIIFLTYQDKYLEQFKRVINKLVSDPNESGHRCAAEMMAGIVRGSKFWTFEQINKLKAWLVPTLVRVLDEMRSETSGYYSSMISYALHNRDVNRYNFLFELRMDSPIRGKNFNNDVARLGFTYLQPRSSWRATKLLNKFWEYCKQFLDHEYKSIRDSLSSVLATNIFVTDLEIEGFGRSDGPRFIELIEYVEPMLQIILDPKFFLADNDSQQNGGIKLHVEANEILKQQKSRAINIMKVVTNCVSLMLNDMIEYKVESFRLLPYACQLDSYELDEDLKSLCETMHNELSLTLIRHKHVPYILDIVEKIAASPLWSTRRSVLQFVKHFVFCNYATIAIDQNYTNRLVNMVVSLLEDERIEVRQYAANTLSGFIHCQFIPDNDKLFRKFRKMGKTPLPADKVNNGRTLISRHAGVLGLCAFVTAFPYSVPDNVPQIFSILNTHLQDPQPTPSTIHRTLREFRRTHGDDWVTHKLKFREDELDILEGMVVPPSHYS